MNDNNTKATNEQETTMNVVQMLFKLFLSNTWCDWNQMRRAKYLQYGSRQRDSVKRKNAEPTILSKFAFQF